MSHVLGSFGAMSPRSPTRVPFPTVPLALARAYHLSLALARERARKARG